MVNVFDINIKIVLRFPPEGFFVAPISVNSLSTKCLFVTRDQLFLNKLDDIRAKMNGDDYELIMVCGILRQLLCDKNRLLDIVNSVDKLKIRFTVNDKIPPDNYLFVYYTDISYLEEQTKQVTIDDLLDTRIFTFIDINFTVKDVIRSGANVQGGIHAGVGENDAETIFSVLDDKVFKAQGLGKKSIKAICSVVLLGLKPLEDLIKERTPAD